MDSALPVLLREQVLLLPLEKPAISTEIQPTSTFPTPRKKGNIDELKVLFSPSKRLHVFQNFNFQKDSFSLDCQLLAVCCAI